MTLLETIRIKQPEMYDLMRDLALIIALADHTGRTSEADNARSMLSVCLDEILKTLNH